MTQKSLRTQLFVSLAASNKLWHYLPDDAKTATKNNWLNSWRTSLDTLAKSARAALAYCESGDIKAARNTWNAVLNRGMIHELVDTTPMLRKMLDATDTNDAAFKNAMQTLSQL